jgi:hypothetical protein
VGEEAGVQRCAVAVGEHVPGVAPSAACGVAFLTEATRMIVVVKPRRNDDFPFRSR